MLGEPSFRLANLMKDKAKSMKIYEVADRAPEARGFGLEKQLLRFGIGKFGISELTVNEQNPIAVGFYERMDFATYKHIEFNEQSNPHPLLCIRRVGIEYINS